MGAPDVRVAHVELVGVDAQKAVAAVAAGRGEVALDNGVDGYSVHGVYVVIAEVIVALRDVRWHSFVP